MTSVSLGAALFASLAWGSSDFLGGLLSRTLRPLHVLAGSQAAAAVLLVAVLLVERPSLTGGPALVWSLVAGLAWELGMAALYTALASGSMGVVAPIASTGSVVGVLTGLVLGERPGPVAIAGVVIALAGVVGASGPDLRGPGRTSRSAVLLAAVAALCFGVEIVALSEASRVSLATALTGMRVAALAGVGIALVALAARRGVGPRRRHPRHAPVVQRPGRADLPGLVAIGALDLAACGALAVASRHGDISLVAALASLYPAVTAVLARLVGERLTPFQRVGIAIVLLGTTCTALATG